MDAWCSIQMGGGLENRHSADVQEYASNFAIQHFGILFRQNKIKWPTQMGAPAPPT
jgi:hypothetical protein